MGIRRFNEEDKGCYRMENGRWLIMIKIFNSFDELKEHFNKIKVLRTFYQEIENTINDIENSKKIKYKYSNSITNLKIYIYVRKLGNKYILITNI